MNKVSYKVFTDMREHFGSCGSWALWNDDTDESVFRPENSGKKVLLNSIVKTFNGIQDEKDFDSANLELRNDVVILALNFASRPKNDYYLSEDIRFASFHEAHGSTSDFRLEAACEDNSEILSGAYITDLVKFNGEKLEGIVNSSSCVIDWFLKNKEGFREQQVNGLIKELKLLGSENPLIVCLGNVVFSAINHKESIKKLKAIWPGLRIIKITHYSKSVRKTLAEYRNTAKDQLKKQLEPYN